MNRCLLTLAASAAVSVAFATAPARTLDGKAIFLTQKCDACHAVSSAEIKSTGKIKAPDLAGRAAKHDAAVLQESLRKEAPINNKKHIKPFTGSDEELGALIAWLQKQNPSNAAKWPFAG